MIKINALLLALTSVALSSCKSRIGDQVTFNFNNVESIKLTGFFEDDPSCSCAGSEIYEVSSDKHESLLDLFIVGRRTELLTKGCAMGRIYIKSRWRVKRITVWYTDDHEPCLFEIGKDFFYGANSLDVRLAIINSANSIPDRHLKPYFYMKEGGFNRHPESENHEMTQKDGLYIIEYE